MREMLYTCACPAHTSACLYLLGALLCVVPAAGWCLAWVRVTNLTSGAKALFTGNLWLDANRQGSQGQNWVKLPAGPDEEPQSLRQQQQQQQAQVLLPGQLGPRSCPMFGTGQEVQQQQGPGGSRLKGLLHGGRPHVQPGYNVTFVTSNIMWAGTSSKVFFELIGEHGSSGARPPQPWKCTCTHSTLTCTSCASVAQLEAVSWHRSAALLAASTSRSVVACPACAAVANCPVNPLSVSCLLAFGLARVPFGLAAGVVYPSGPRSSQFSRGVKVSFLYPRLPYVGKLHQLRVGTDGSGLFAAWHLHRVEVAHVHTGESWLFECNAWLDRRNTWQLLLPAGSA